MLEQIPDQVDPFSLAQSGTEISGDFPVGEMERIHSLLYAPTGTVEINVHFGQDASGIPFLRGSLSTTLQLACQRCMEPLEQDVSSQFEMGLVRSEEDEEMLPERYEPLLVELDGEFSLHAFLEDELILSLPLAVSHPPEQCSATQYLDDPTEIKKKNPFEVLAQLKD